MAKTHPFNFCWRNSFLSLHGPSQARHACIITTLILYFRIQWSPQVFLAMCDCKMEIFKIEADVLVHGPSSEPQIVSFNPLVSLGWHTCFLFSVIACFDSLVWVSWLLSLGRHIFMFSYWFCSYSLVTSLLSLAVLIGMLSLFSDCFHSWVQVSWLLNLGMYTFAPYVGLLSLLSYHGIAFSP